MQPEELINSEDIAKLREIEEISKIIERAEESYMNNFTNLVFLDKSDKWEIQIKNKLFKIVLDWTSISAIIKDSKNVKKLDRNLVRSGFSLSEFVKNLSWLHSEIKDFLLDRKEEVRGVIIEYFSEDYITQHFKFCEDIIKLDDFFVCVFNLRKSFTDTIQEISLEVKKLSVALDEAINVNLSPGSILFNINRILGSFNRYQIVEVLQIMGEFFEIFKKYDFFEDSKNKIADTKLLAENFNTIGSDYRKLDQAFADFKKFYDSWIKVKSNFSEFIKLSQKFQFKLPTEDSLEFGRLLSQLIGKELTIENIRGINSILRHMYLIASQNAEK